jgi:hypothetical protein
MKPALVIFKVMSNRRQVSIHFHITVEGSLKMDGF